MSTDLMTDVITQWGKANQAALENFANTIAQASNASTANSAMKPMEINADTWKAFVKNYMEKTAEFSANKEAAMDTAWRTQRDKLDLNGSASALQDLAQIHVNLLSRLMENHVQNINAITGFTTQYFNNLALARGGNDIMMALGQLATDLQASSKLNATEIAVIVNGIQPALTQWVQANVETTDKKTADESDAIITPAKKSRKK
ncbi:MAG: hypothetical protein NWQ13_09350 [Glaciimonas sp.]|nr:hypothetical protein [Glaciimonas sp.]